MSTIQPVRAGLVLGAVIGLWHMCWSLLVAIGWAQPLIDFVFWMHFLKPIYLVQPFNAATAAILVVVTAVMGFVIGVVFGAIWNWIARSSGKV